MRILVATDAWKPQLNGVVRTYERLAIEIPKLGAEVDFLTPEPYATLPLPTYPEIRLAVVSKWGFAEVYDRARPDYIHIATEGPIGIAARSWCLQNSHPYTTAYHTRFPDLIAARMPAVPLSWGYALQRWFHNYGAGMMVAAPSMGRDLEAKGFQRIMPWTRGVDTDLFKPRPELRPRAAAPVFLYVGRIAVEKGVEDFLQLDLPGTKVVVGDGPQLDDLRRRYPLARFAGPKANGELAAEYASADVFVFPSRTDTFGVVLLEAMASGLPVAALPVTGPIDIIHHGETGFLDTDLRCAAINALSLDRAAVRRQALTYSWANCARLFLDNVLTANGEAGHQPTRDAIAMGA